MKLLQKSALIERLLPLLATLASLVGCVLFLRLYLTQTSRQFAEDFSNQNLSALVSGDSYQLAGRLNSLSSSVHWVCISAKRAEETIYDRAKSSYCGESYLQTVVQIPAKTNDSLSVRFTLALSRALKWGGIGFVFLQLFLLWSLFFAGRKAALRTERAKQEGQLQLSQLATQFSHDIRSPLASLQAVIHNARGLDEETRINVRTAVNRIKDIANNLLTKNREVIATELQPETEEGSAQVNQSLSGERRSAQLLSAVLDSAISLARARFFEHENVEIHLEIGDDAQTIFTEIQPTELSRMISNLVNNAVESFENGGAVKASLTCSASQAVIEVKDNGKGMPPEVLAKVGKRGATFGKIEGNGLGVFHAKATVESWGGAFEIKSAVGDGTTVRLEIPLTETPQWLMSSLNISAGTTVVIADDDPSIHQVWDRRLSALPDVELVHLHNTQELLEWYRKNFTIDNVLYLCDYEFAGQKETGMDLIEMMGTAPQSVLVTSRWDETEVRRRCEKIGLKLLLKSLAATVRIKSC